MKLSIWSFWWAKHEKTVQSSQKAICILLQKTSAIHQWGSRPSIIHLAVCIYECKYIRFRHFFNALIKLILKYTNIYTLNSCLSMWSFYFSMKIPIPAKDGISETRLELSQKYISPKVCTQTHAISLHKHFWTSGWLTETLDYKKRSLKTIFTNHALIFNILANKSAFTVVRQVNPHLKVQGGFKSVPWLLCICVATGTGHGWEQCPTTPSAWQVEQECPGAPVEPLAEPALSLSQQYFVNEEIRGG